MFTLGYSLQILTYSFSTTRAKQLLLRRHFSDSELRRKDLPVHNILQAWFYIALGRGCSLGLENPFNAPFNNINIK